MRGSLTPDDVVVADSCRRALRSPVRRRAPHRFGHVGAGWPFAASRIQGRAPRTAASSPTAAIRSAASSTPWQSWARPTKRSWSMASRLRAGSRPSWARSSSATWKTPRCSRTRCRNCDDPRGVASRSDTRAGRRDSRAARRKLSFTGRAPKPRSPSRTALRPEAIRRRLS